MSFGKRTIGLVRVSTILQTEENGGTSIQLQTEKLKQYADLHDLELNDVIVDVASGGLETRDGVEKLKEMIERKEVDKVLIYNVSRAFRSMVHFTTFYEYLKKNNVELISVCEGLRSSRKEHQMIFGIMCSVAAFEKDTINFRLHNGRKTKVRNGERGFGGRLPFGYKRFNGNVITDSNADIVKYIFKKTNQLNKRNITKTKKTQTLLKLLKDRGFTYNGKDFKNWNIRTILNNPFYVGEMNYSGINTTHNYEKIISKRMFNQV